jgi:hypothetical protein
MFGAGGRARARGAQRARAVARGGLELAADARGAGEVADALFLIYCMHRSEYSAASTNNLSRIGSTLWSWPCC